MSEIGEFGDIGDFGEFIDLTNRLAAVMTREAELLRAMRSSEIAALQEGKAALAAAYAGALGVVRKNAAEVNAAGPGRRQALEEATAGLKRAVDDNLRAVNTARTVNERLIKALSAAVAETRLPVATYTAAGTSAAAPAGQLSLAVDNRI